LRTTNNDKYIYVKRLYAYLNEQPIIQDIISKKIAGSDYDCEQFVDPASHMGHGNKVNIPVNEADHIKAMYSLLGELAGSENQSMIGIAMSFHYTSSRKFDDIIQSFLEKVFKPLIDFIVDALSKEMMVLEQSKLTPQFNQHIEHNYGTANVGETITSTNIVQQSDLQEILSLITTLKSEIENSSVGEQEKESVFDDLDVIKEQAEADTPKPSRLKKAISGIKTFVAGATGGATAATALVVSANTLVEKLEQVFGNIF
jgi:hypothetical protein